MAALGTIHGVWGAGLLVGLGKVAAGSLLSRIVPADVGKRRR